MKDKALEAQLLQLADRSGIEGGRVFEVAKSEDTKQLNAYVNGFGATQRIVLWDTILKAMDRPQLLAVMGHEMGHYVLKHVWQLMARGDALDSRTAVRRLPVVGRPDQSLRWPLRFTSLADVASLPLILLLVGAMSLVIDPLTLAFSRHIEHEADRFTLELTHDNHAAGERAGHPAAGESRRAASRLALYLVPREPPAARRAHRLQQRLPAVGVGPAARLRGSIQVGAAFRRHPSQQAFLAQRGSRLARSAHL